MKRVLSLCFVLALLACLAMPVFAADALGVIEITGLSEPKPGRCPSFGANLLQSDVAKIANISWMDLSTDSYMSGTDAFRYSTEEVEIGYRLEITVMITDPSRKYWRFWPHRSGAGFLYGYDAGTYLLRRLCHLHCACQVRYLRQGIRQAQSGKSRHLRLSQSRWRFQAVYPSRCKV